MPPILKLARSHTFVFGRSVGVLAFGFLAACSGGGGSAGPLRVVSSNLTEGAGGWHLNRPLRVVFDRPLDPSSVNQGTVHVRQPSGLPAFGSVGLDPDDPRAVLWQPDCPVLEDLSDAGLSPDTEYALSVLGSGPNAAFVVRGADGTPLEQSFSRRFTTVSGSQLSQLFVDGGVGPPVAVTRAAGSTLAAATHVVVDGVPHYFERQVGGGVVLEPPLSLPLNLLSDPATRVELVLQFDQPVDMRAANLGPARIRWEFEKAPGAWTPIATALTLESNCTGSGATVRLRPAGLLPPATRMRVFVAAAFQDIAGHAGSLSQTDFAVASTAAPASAGTLRDELLESFASRAREDALAAFGEPHADWGTGGALTAASGFEGSGGPGGDFDWRVGPGEIVFLNTVSGSIVGGPGFAKTKSVPIVGGVLDLRNLWIEDGGLVRFDGPNPVRILVSGTARIDGTLDVSGTNSAGVNTLNTTFQPEPGAPGQCGGGRGGVGSPLVSASTPRGGTGAGAFDAPGLGGEGGETGWSNPVPGLSTAKEEDARRGAGGGGGRFGADVPDPSLGGRFDQSRIGFDAEPGFDNDEAKNGALGGAGPARGGSVGPAPFVDGDPTNDFFGTLFDPLAQRWIAGELRTPWAGAGGGAGGDAADVPKGQSFPAAFKPGGDEKGAGGGGGGGSLHLLVLGDVVFGPNGRLEARGGTGGGGENSSVLGGLRRLGGGSGGGSGGHVVVETAGVLDLSAVVGRAAIVATGGQGGAGKLDQGGAWRSATGMKETAPIADACPVGEVGCLAAAPGGSLPAPGAGGDGGPGLVQLHTAGGAIGVDVLLAPGETLASLVRPPPISAPGVGSGSGSGILLPSFGRYSRARSSWIALGDGGFDTALGAHRDVRFHFEGIHPVDGPGFRAGDVVREASGTQVAGLAPIATAQQVAAVGRTLDFDVSHWIGAPEAAYIEQPALLQRFLVELVDASQPTNFQRFAVVASRFDSASATLSVDLDPAGPPLDSFVSSGAVEAELQPAYFRVSTAGVPDSLPASANVSITLAATTADALGQPRLSFGPGQDEPLLQGVTDVDDPVTGLNFPGNRDLRFVRFEVRFDRDAAGGGLSPASPVPSLDDFRLRFEYP